MPMTPRTLIAALLLFAGLAPAAHAVPVLDTPAVAHASAVCADYTNQAAAQRAADTRDGDGDGIYCESLPCPCLKPGFSAGKVSVNSVYWRGPYVQSRSLLATAAIAYSLRSASQPGMQLPIDSTPVAFACSWPQFVHTSFMAKTPSAQPNRTLAGNEGNRQRGGHRDASDREGPVTAGRMCFGVKVGFRWWA